MALASASLQLKENEREGSVDRETLEELHLLRRGYHKRLDSEDACVLPDSLRKDSLEGKQRLGSEGSRVIGEGTVCGYAIKEINLSGFFFLRIFVLRLIGLHLVEMSMSILGHGGLRTKYLC
jgi:hypothetical protein